VPVVARCAIEDEHGDEYREDELIVLLLEAKDEIPDTPAAPVELGRS